MKKTQDNVTSRNEKLHQINVWFRFARWHWSLVGLYLEGKLSGVLGDAAAVHEGEHVPDSVRVQHHVSSKRADAAVGEGRRYHWQAIAVGL